MDYVNHGGHCCGYGHIYGFDNATINDLTECLVEHDDAARGVNRICEVILSERQVNPSENDRRVLAEVRAAGGWPTILAQRGFRLAAQWQNSNTGRRCYQFIKVPRLLTDDEGYRPPFAWDGPVVNAVNGNVAPPPPPPAPPPVHTVEREYYANLQNSGRRGPFITEAAARAAFPRCRRFERREIRSDGSSVWTPTA